MRILCATDGSRGAAAAAAFLAALPLRAEDEVRLLAVTPLAAAVGEEPFAAARASLAAVPAALSTEVRSGSPAVAIVEAAREWQAEIIALGAMGATGLARYFIGSVAERVLRTADRPVLVARPLRHHLARVVVALDGSEFSRRVVEGALAVPLPPETETRLVTVLPSREVLLGAAPLVMGALSQQLDALLAEAVTETEGRLRECARPFREAGRKVTAEIFHGDTASALLETAEAADLIVLGSHGESGLDRFLLGSVSEKLARHAPCSVLVVR